MKAAGETGIEKLLSISSRALSAKPRLAPELFEAYPTGQALFRMLQRKNGFYAFESTLHVFPLASRDCLSLEEWNSTALWRGGYSDLAEGLLFFAEDAFQDQFCLSENGVVRFTAETGATTAYADSIENWAIKLLAGYRQETGWVLATTWQAANGPLAPGKRLMPKTPFFLGGEYALDNLWPSDAVEGMRSRADLAIQTRDVSDGSAVRLIVGKKPKPQ